MGIDQKTAEDVVKVVEFDFETVRLCTKAVRSGEIGIHESGGFTIRTPILEVSTADLGDDEPMVWLDTQELSGILDAAPTQATFDIAATDHKTAPNVILRFSNFQVLCRTTTPSAEPMERPESDFDGIGIPTWMSSLPGFGRHVIEIHEDSVRASLCSGSVGYLVRDSTFVGSGYGISSEFARVAYRLASFLEAPKVSRDDQSIEIKSQGLSIRGPVVDQSSTPDLSELEPKDESPSSTIQIRPWKMEPLDLILDKHTIGQDEWILNHWPNSGWWIVSELDARANVHLREDTGFDGYVSFPVSARQFGQAIKAANCHSIGTPEIRFWSERQPVQVKSGNFECYLARRTRP